VMSGWIAKLYSCSTHSCGHPRTESRARAVNLYRSASTMNPALSIGRMFRSYRSAKSVQWMREKVVGVSRFCFFPAWWRSGRCRGVPLGEEDLVAGQLQPPLEQVDLGRLPRAVEPLDGDQLPRYGVRKALLRIRSLLPIDGQLDVHAKWSRNIAALAVTPAPPGGTTSGSPPAGAAPRPGGGNRRPHGRVVLLVQGVGDPQEGGEGPHGGPVLLGKLLVLRVGRPGWPSGVARHPATMSRSAGERPTISELAMM